MSSLGAGKGLLEVGKFAVYVTVPIVLMYAFANNTHNLHKFMRGPCLMGCLQMIYIYFSFCGCSNHLKKMHSYVVYPPEAPRPPSPEEMREMARDLARKRNNQ